MQPNDRDMFEAYVKSFKNHQLLNPESKQEPLARQEYFATFLRKSKKRQILNAKRLKLSMVEMSQLEVTPSDFLHVASSGVDFSGSL